LYEIIMDKNVLMLYLNFKQKEVIWMRRSQFIKSALLAMISVLLVAGISQAREVKGKTKSFCRHLVASAVATDGSAVSGPVTVVKRVQLASGKILYVGKYSLDVPEGRKVMMVFQKVRANGTLKPKTVAEFATDDTGLLDTTQFTVTAPLIGGSLAIDLGRIKVRGRLATPQLNPLEDVDNDNDGISDLDDNDDDNDAIEDNQDEDEDGDGVVDQGEDMDTDDDGIPNVVDADDDNDGIADNQDEDEDGDGIIDSNGDEDSDGDSIADADDPDDDNDGIEDNQDEDSDGDGILDVLENGQARLLKMDEHQIVFAKGGYVYTVTV
jgi:hypothetical protein